MAQQISYGALDYQNQAAEIERRRKFAEALQAQGATPMGNTEMVGGWALKKSPWEGVGKLAQSLSGAYQAKLADEDLKKLNADQKTKLDQADARVFAAASGVPNLATNDVRVATASPQWMTDAQSDLAQKQPTRDEIRRNTLAAALAHPEMRGPAMAAFLQQMTANPESQFAKIDPSKFTPESVARFAGTGNHADLVARDRLEFQNLGGALAGLNPYTGAQVMSTATSMRPGEVASNTLGRDRLAWDQYQFGNLSANQQQNLGIDRARLANQGIQTQFDTGQGVGAPIIAGLPQNAPMQFTQTGGGSPPAAAAQAPAPVVAKPRAPAPVAAPRAAPDGLTPAARVAVAKDNALKTQEAARDLPQVVATAQQAIDNIDAMIGSEDGTVKRHPGFEGVVGATMLPGARFVPGTDAASFDKRLEQTHGQTFMQAYQSLKGGGQITEIEGKKATDALNRMDRSQSEAEFVKAAREYQGILKAAVSRAQQKAGAPAQPAYTGPRTQIVPPQGMNAARGGDVLSQADAILAGGR